MKLSAPKQGTWLVSVIIGGVGILAHVVPIPQLAPYAFWLVAVGFILLAIGALLDGI